MYLGEVAKIKSGEEQMTVMNHNAYERALAYCLHMLGCQQMLESFLATQIFTFPSKSNFKLCVTQMYNCVYIKI